MRLRHPCPLPLSAWQSEIAIGNRDGIRPNRLNPIVLPWQSRWNRRFDRIIGNTAGDIRSQVNRAIEEPWDQKPIRFQDAIGRRYPLPLEVCRTLEVHCFAYFNSISKTGTNGTNRVF